MATRLPGWLKPRTAPSMAQPGAAAQTTLAQSSNHVGGHAHDPLQLRQRRRKLPGSADDSSHGRKHLPDNSGDSSGSRRRQDLQNHPRRQVDGAAQLSRGRRLPSICRAGPGYRRELLRDNLGMRRGRRRHCIQPVCRAWSVRGNTAHVRAGGSGHKHPRNESDRRHQRQLQRHTGSVHRRLAFSNHHHRARRRDDRYCHGAYTLRSALEQRGLPSAP